MSGCLWAARVLFGGGSCSLILVLPLFVFVGSVSIASSTPCLQPPLTSLRAAPKPAPPGKAGEGSCEVANSSQSCTENCLPLVQGRLRNDCIQNCNTWTVLGGDECECESGDCESDAPGSAANSATGAAPALAGAVALAPL